MEVSPTSAPDFEDDSFKEYFEGVLSTLPISQNQSYENFLREHPWTLNDFRKDAERNATTADSVKNIPVDKIYDFFDEYEYYAEGEGNFYGGGDEEISLFENQNFIFVVEGIFLTVISIFGVIGTVMSIGVLIKPALRKSFTALLTGLAVCDTLFLLTSIVMFGLPKLWVWFAHNVTNPTAPFLFGLIHIWRVGSTCLTLSVTLERYWAICRPLKRKSCMINQGYLLTGSLIFAVAYNIPKFFEIRNVTLSSGEIMSVTSEMRENHYYKKFYVFWSKFILIELIPYITIIFLNTRILLKTVKASRFRQRFLIQGEPSSNNNNNDTQHSGSNNNQKQILIRQDTEDVHHVTRLAAKDKQLHSPLLDNSDQTKSEGTVKNLHRIDTPKYQKKDILTENKKLTRTKRVVSPKLSSKTQEYIYDSGSSSIDEEDTISRNIELERFIAANNEINGSDLRARARSCSVIILQQQRKHSKEEEDNPLQQKENLTKRTCVKCSTRSLIFLNVTQEKEDNNSADKVSWRKTANGNGDKTLKRTNSSEAIIVMNRDVPSPCIEMSKDVPTNKISTCHSRGDSKMSSGRASSTAATIVVSADPNTQYSNQKISVQTSVKDRKLGATLIGVSLLFISCQSLKLIPDIYEGFFCTKDVATSGYCRSKYINTLICFSNLLMCINSAANFLMYMLRGSKFRLEFVKMYLK